MATPPVFSAGAVLTAAQMNAVGLWLVKETSIGTAVSTTDVTSCFTSDFDNYRIDIAGPTSNVGACAFTIQYLSGSTPSTTGYYHNTFYILAGQTGALTNANNNNTVAYNECGNCDTRANYCSFDVWGPNIATYTRTTFMNTDDSYLRWSSGVHKVATAYDGFRLGNNGGAVITGGKIRVYGYRKG